ncbi:hypothetical protein C2G38_2182315 [Gigaspora rosea]|uniref:Uncharacterized protein n=1 Tax=Gigaspora rosea TaxID=44941 RepID=A0A397VC29_9GLOM|nr:hypothetical protein C2G38_2182315 [Gigaspora rosea]
MLAKLLCKNTTPTSLSLCINDRDTLCKNIILTSLDLGYNFLESEGGKALADALYKNISLKDLNLQYNGKDEKH